MKTRDRAARILSRIVAVLVLPASLLAEPVPLRRVVELALTHATAGAMSAADEQRAAENYRELHDSYIPQLIAGAGLGPPSYGFPLSIEGEPPSLFTINMQSSLLNPSLRAFLHAAQAETKVASLKDKDQRNQIIQDAVLSYAELAKWEQRLSRLMEISGDEDKMLAAVAERVKEGVDSEVDAMHAKLSAARVRERLIEAQGSVAVLRGHLAELTGLPVDGIETEAEALPEFPAPPLDTATPAHAADTNPSVQAAVEHARAQYLRAEGEHRVSWPSFDLGAQYALLSTFNNFQNYYIPERICTVSSGTFLCPTGSFHQNNASIGISIRFPFLNLSQRARARAADADAIKATKQAEAAKNQASEETLRLQRSVAQMQAAHDVAELEYEIAQNNLAAIQIRVDAGTANIHELDDARTKLNEQFIALQDVIFELQRSELGLLRATGDLEKWALGR